MTALVFLKRVVLCNYKSIAVCSVKLGPLTFLVGPNGASKSNFLDALRPI
jgi:AAA15 family ATPase/GTPase